MICYCFFAAGAAFFVGALISSVWVKLALGMIFVGLGFLCKRP